MDERTELCGATLSKAFAENSSSWRKYEISCEGQEHCPQLGDVEKNASFVPEQEKYDELINEWLTN